MLTSAALEVLVLVLAGLVGALVAAVVVLGLRLRRLGSDQRRAFDGVEVDVLAALARHTRRLDGADTAIEEVRAHGAATRADLAGALTRMAIVRYDAFDDVGGELSFSAALLDEHDDGIVITAINGRSEGRTYAKLVSGGSTAAMLSDEERSAIETARRGGRTEERADGRGSRRWRDRERA